MKFIAVLQRFFKTDLRYIYTKAPWPFMSQVFISLVGFSMSIVFANFLFKETYGTYQYVLSVAETLGVLALSGAGIASIRAAAQGYEGSLEHARNLYLKYSILILIVAGAASGYYFYNDNTLLGWSLLIAGSTVPLINAHKLYSSYLAGKKLFREAALYAVAHTVLTSSAIATAVFFSDSTLTLICTYFFSHAVILSLFYYHTKKHFVHDTAVDPGFKKYSRDLSVMNIITTLAAQADKIIIFQFIGAAPLAAYLLAISPARQVQHVFKSIGSIAMPKMSSIPFPTLQSTLSGKIAKLYLIIIPITVAYILLAPHLFALVFPLYPESIALSQLYAIIFLCIPLSFFQEAILAHAMSKTLFKTRIATIVVKIVSLFVFVQLYGLWGVLYSVLLTQFFSSLFITVLFFREKAAES